MLEETGTAEWKCRKYEKVVSDMRMTEKRNRTDGLWGLMVGDALGVPAEFKSRDKLRENPVTDMTGFGTHNQEAGTWSDDTSMTLATMDSLNHGIDYENMMKRFKEWLLYNKKYTPHGEVFDAGLVCRRAIMNFTHGFEVLECGEDGEYSNGNGSLMRILPAVLYVLKDAQPLDEEKLEVIHNVSRLTHSHPISLTGCGLYAFLVEELLKADAGEDVRTVLQRGIDRGFFHYENGLDKYQAAALWQYRRLEELEDFEKLEEDEIQSTGYVAKTLEAALWCLLTTRSFKECVLKAVNLGGDTDTVAAVAGSLAGYVYGRGVNTGIPEEWLRQLSRYEWLEERVRAFDQAL